MNRIKKLLMFVTILTFGIILTSCTNEDSPVIPVDDIETQLHSMTLKEKIGQMFYVRLESMDTTIHWKTYADLQENPMHDLNKTIRGVNANYPIGGLILYAWNIKDEPQLAKLISDVRALNGKPLLCIDEEGGRIARIANNENFDVEVVGPMAEIGKTGDRQDG